MSVKTKTLVCSVRGAAINAVRFDRGRDIASCEFLSVNARSASPADLQAALAGVMKKAGPGRLVMALPQKQCSCRFLKVPSVDEREIELMVKLQAYRLLPAYADELVVRFLVTSKGADGYANVTVIIVRREIVELYRQIAEGAGAGDYAITAGLNGLFNLYKKTVKAEGVSAVMEINPPDAEVIFCSGESLFFSRSFSLPEKGWQKTLGEEYRKTEEAFLKEQSASSPGHVFCFASPSVLKELSGAHLPPGFEAVAFWSGSSRPEQAVRKLEAFPFSFGSLWGAGQTPVSESLDLVPDDVRVFRKTRAAKKEAVTAGIFCLVAVLFLWAGLWLENSELARSLAEAKKRIAAVEPEAKKLEQFEKKISGSGGGGSGLDILRSISESASGIHLTSLVFEAGYELSLRGYAREMQDVFLFASGLEASKALAGYKATVRRTAQRRLSQGSVIDFEITCKRR